MTYDVLIVGGGITGLTLACALAQKSSLTIGILDTKKPVLSWSLAQYHHRVSAITLASQQIFCSLNVWQQIKNKRVSSFNQVEVYDANHVKMEFNSREISEGNLGFIIENNVLQDALLENIAEYSHIHLHAPEILTKIKTLPDKIELSTAEKTFSAKLAIAADGAQSWLRQQTGIAVDTHRYDEIAIVATVQTEWSHQKMARQIFLETGPLAFLPLCDEHLCSIVWSLPTDIANTFMTLDDEAFAKKLTETMGLGAIKKVAPRYLFPLSRQKADHYIQERIALIGDAAHVVHPLAGQGVNMGLLDAASLAEVILDAHQTNRDFSSRHHLRRYERWRRADNFALFSAIDMFKTIFANKKKSMQSLRGLGMKMINQRNEIKNLFTRHATGRRNDLPKLARRV